MELTEDKGKRSGNSTGASLHWRQRQQERKDVPTPPYHFFFDHITGLAFCTRYIRGLEAWKQLMESAARRLMQAPTGLPELLDACVKAGRMFQECEGEIQKAMNTSAGAGGDLMTHKGNNTEAVRCVSFFFEWWALCVSGLYAYLSLASHRRLIDERNHQL